jgi:DNA modification methylase
MKAENGMTATPVEPIVSPIVPFYDRDGITIYNADCRDVLPTLGKFDLLLTDPPYGLGNKIVSSESDPLWGRMMGKANTWDKTTVPQMLIDQAVDTANTSVIWGGNYYALPPVRCWLAWDKKQEHTSGHFEMAWTTIELPTRMFRMGRIEEYNGGQPRKVHPTQKPLVLMKWCIGLVPEAKSVLDPFMGSGTTLVAAKLLGLRAVGIEINVEYCRIAVERLRQGVLCFDSEG